jgi:hypothetical protein
VATFGVALVAPDESFWFRPVGLVKEVVVLDEELVGVELSDLDV